MDNELRCAIQSKKMEIPTCCDGLHHCSPSAIVFSKELRLECFLKHWLKLVPTKIWTTVTWCNIEMKLRQFIGLLGLLVGTLFHYSDKINSIFKSNESTSADNKSLNWVYGSPNLTNKRPTKSAYHMHNWYNLKMPHVVRNHPSILFILDSTYKSTGHICPSELRLNDVTCYHSLFSS